MGYFFWFWYKVIGQASYIIRSRKRETKRAYDLLDQIERQFSGRFNPNTKKKIAVSYGIYNPMICDAFTRLRGRPTHDGERIRFIHYFICSSLFDDFTDYALITEEQLRELSFAPDKYQPHGFDERAFLNAHLLLRQFVTDKPLYDRISETLFEAQMQSKKQYQSTLSDESLKAITFNKGGNSVLLCRFYLDTAIETSETEDACWYRMGTLIQLTNDLFDIYKDLQDHITTLPNNMKDACVFEQYFIDQIQDIKTLIGRLPFSQKNKQAFSLSMAGIYAFGLIALDQLKSIQEKTGQLPQLSTLDRKALIIDMEKPGNLVRWFKFTYRYAKL
jgi:hypothetical protein